MMRSGMRLIWGAGFLLTLMTGVVKAAEPAAPVGAAGSGAGKAEILRAQAVPVSGAVTQPGAAVRLDVTLTLASGWHVNANPAGDPAMRPTVVELAPQSPGTLVAVRYPAGIPQPGPGGPFGDPTAAPLVYESGTIIPVAVRLPADAPTGPMNLMLRLKYQACNDRACRPPATLDLPVRLEVAAP